jgi:hypothetical protein
MADKWPLANGNWSNAANWNGGTKPVAGDDVFADGRTLNVDESFDVATLRNTQRSGGTNGGVFVFNTAGVTGNVTSTTPLFLTVFISLTLIQITATTGTVTINLGGTVSLIGLNASSLTYFAHSGACNLTVNGSSYIGTNQPNQFSRIFTQTSTGTLTITGNSTGATNFAGSSQNEIINSSAGTTIVNGNITGGSTVVQNRCINKTSGLLTVNGNVTGGTSGNAILFSGTQLSVTGNVLGVANVAAIDTSAPVNNITGNVTAGTLPAISSTSANIINVTGTVTASATAVAISMTNANGQVYLNGNMVNNNGKMAIYAPIVWLDRTGTTTASFFTSGGSPRTLYSEDTVPNTPATNNVRSGTTYGAGSTLVGTVVMPTATNVRSGVVYDNGTTGTALFTTSQFLTEISGSSDAVAVRIKNCATPQILGEILEAYKK